MSRVGVFVVPNVRNRRLFMWVIFLREQGRQRVASPSRAAALAAAAEASARVAATAAEEKTSDSTTTAAPSSRTQQVMPAARKVGKIARVLDSVLILFSPSPHASEAIILVE